MLRKENYCQPAQRCFVSASEVLNSPLMISRASPAKLGNRLCGFVDNLVIVIAGDVSDIAVDINAAQSSIARHSGEHVKAVESVSCDNSRVDNRRGSAARNAAVWLDVINRPYSGFF